jgi:hypothetical protein
MKSFEGVSNEKKNIAYPVLFSFDDVFIRAKLKIQVRPLEV